MFTNHFGIEIEFTGITRNQAARSATRYLGGTVANVGGHYDAYTVITSDGRVWKFMSDGSIACQRKEQGRTVPASSKHSVDLVSPILLYREDIETLQGLVRVLRKAGGFTNNSCSIHIHLDGSNHTPRSIWNFVNIIASHNDLFYKALQIEPQRMRYCKKMDVYLVEQLNNAKPTTMAQIESIWYERYSGSHEYHYHQSRYHFLNLHSFFHGHHTVGIRGFNGTLHGDVIKKLNHQMTCERRTN